MQKDLLTRFISKYSIGGAVESAKLSVHNSTISTTVSTSDRTLTASTVSMTGFLLDDVDICIYDTPKLLKMLSVLDNVITMGVHYVQVGKPTYLSFNDTNTSVNYILADESVIPKAGRISQEPAWEFTLPIDSEFSSRFIKAKSALSDSDYFTVLSDNGEYIIALGYSEITSNRININTGVPCNIPFKPISFSSSYFKEILSANKDANRGVLNVSSKGLANVQFTGDDFNCNYYLVKFNV